MPNNDFSELDYEPKKKSGCLLPGLLLVIAVALIAALIVFLGSRNEALIDIVDPEDEELIEETDLPVLEPAQTETLPEEDEETAEEAVEVPPDYDQLEAAMSGWLVFRLKDPDVIMVHTSELDDVEGFLERYSLEEDNIIVYQVESTDEQFVTAAFGLPYSEWSIQAVFIWRNNEWEFLREEPIG